MEIFEYLKQLRLHNKLSLQEYVEKLKKITGEEYGDKPEENKWSISKLSKIEAGSQKLNVEELKLLSKALGKTFEEVVIEASKENIIPVNMFSTDANSMEADLRSLLQQVLDEYHNAIQGEFRGTPFRDLVTIKIPEAIQHASQLNIKQYMIKGSIGNGQFADIPWVSIFNTKIATSATKGIYIVYLFAHDMSGVYVSLNQGFTYFEDRFSKDKTTTGITEIEKAAKYIRKQCRGITQEFDMPIINLKSGQKLARGYAAGHICGKFYKSGLIPDNNELVADIYKLLSIYDEIINIKGNRKVEQFYDDIVNNAQGLLLDDKAYLEEADRMIPDIDNLSNISDNVIKPSQKLPPSVTRDGAESYPRNPKTAAKALKLAHYKCENNENHITFTKRSTKKNYTEPHHLIPLSAYNDFEYSLDNEANICSLCCICHNCLHYGVDEERLPILKKLFKERHELLTKANIEISFEELKKYYSIELV